MMLSTSVENASVQSESKELYKNGRVHTLCKISYISAKRVHTVA